MAVTNPNAHQYNPSIGAADHVAESLTLNQIAVRITSTPSAGNAIPGAFPVPPCTTVKRGAPTNQMAAASTIR